MQGAEQLRPAQAAQAHQLQQLLLEVVVLLAHVAHELADGGLAAAAQLQQGDRQGWAKGTPDCGIGCDRVQRQVECMPTLLLLPR